MAYMNQERKKALVDGVKKMLAEKFPDVKIKATYKIQNYSAICMTIQGCSINLLENFPNKHWFCVNTYHIGSAFHGEAGEFLQACADALNKGNHDNSDPMTDYFDVGWYIDIHIGKMDKPFQVLTKN